MIFNRRHFLISAASLAACGPELAKPFNGVAYIASQAARTVSIVSLSRFRLSKQVALDAEPSEVLVDSTRAYVLTPANGTVTELDASVGTIAGKHKLAGSAVSMRLSADAKSIWLLARDPQALIQLDLKSGRTAKTIKLPNPLPISISAPSLRWRQSALPPA